MKNKNIKSSFKSSENIQFLYRLWNPDPILYEATRAGLFVSRFMQIMNITASMLIVVRVSEQSPFKFSYSLYKMVNWIYGYRIGSKYILVKALTRQRSSLDCLYFFVVLIAQTSPYSINVIVSITCMLKVALRIV